MEAINKLKDLATHMDLEPAEEAKVGSLGRIAPCGLVVEEKPRRRQRINEDLGVFHAAMPGGKTIPLLKTLLTSACERNCVYCASGIVYTALSALDEITGEQRFRPMRWLRRLWICGEPVW